MIGTGTLSLVEDKAEKILGLNCLMKQTTNKSKWEYGDKILNGLAVFRLDVEKMSCKAK